MRQRPTMQDVATAAGVSISTVDRILNRRAPVKRATVDQVLAAARRIGYHGVPSIHERLTEGAPQVTFGFLLNGRDRALYADLARQLAARCRGSGLVRARALVHHLVGISGPEAAAAITALGQRCDALAVVAVDAPEVRAAIAALAEAGRPVFTMLSDIDLPERAGFAGSDPRKIGRAAGWMLDRLAPAEGKVGLMIGDALYAAHRGYRQGLADYLAEYRSRLVLIEAGETQERDARAAVLVNRLLADEPGLVALVVAGGGLGGAISALRAAGRADLVLIGTELSPEVDAGLAEGLVDVVVSHPAGLVTEAVVTQMERAMLDRPGAPVLTLVPVEIRIRETL